MYSLLFILINFIYMSPLPTVHLVQGKWSKLESAPFSRSTDGSLADFPTFVKLRAGKKYFSISFQCEKDDFVAQNYLTVHNSPLFNQEVFEVFIATRANDPTQYLEIEINPNNAIWVGKVNFPSMGEGNDMSADMVGHEESGIKHTVTKGKNKWSGTLEIPWTLIGGSAKGLYRLNLYRIVSKKAHKNKKWTCHPDNCEFLCWSSTMSGEVPAFHRPKRFGKMLIE
jgi:hypothetical protein